MSQLSNKLRSGGVVTGLWLMTPTPVFGELVRRSGLDFVVVDMEHGAHSLDTLVDMLRSVQGGTTAVIARVPSHDPTIVSRVLDRGADGVMVPRVEDRETAVKMAAGARFPPHGERGLALRALRASGYGTEADYRDRSDREVIVMVQLESGKALDHAIAITTAPGVDMAFIGPADLAANLRLEGAEHQNEFRNLVDEKIRELRRANVLVGTVPYGGHTPRSLTEVGVQLFITGSDIGIMSAGLKQFCVQSASETY